MKGLFRKKRRRGQSKRQTDPAPFDDNETIVINLTSGETIDPNEVRVEFDDHDRDVAAARPKADQDVAAEAPVRPESRARDEAPPAASSGSASSIHEDDDGDRTQIWTVGGTVSRPSAGATSAEPAREAPKPPAGEGRRSISAVEDFALTAGLLMIMEGKGRGMIFAVNLGRNKLGRGPDNEICIDNGDEAISRNNHATIAVDPKTRRIFLVPGDSTNLAYLDEDPLLEVKEIKDKATIQLGETKLVLIQLLGNYLEWH